MGQAILISVHITRVIYCLGLVSPPCYLTLRLIDDGSGMKKKILAFRNLECNYDVGTLYEVITDVLTEWKIKESMLLIFAGVGPPNPHMVGDLTSKLLDWDLCYLSCYAQILNLLVQDGFYGIKNVLCKIRESIVCVCLET